MRCNRYSAAALCVKTCEAAAFVICADFLCEIGETDGQSVGKHRCSWGRAEALFGRMDKWVIQEVMNICIRY